MTPPSVFWFDKRLSLGSISDSAANLAQASALVVGGGWAFMKYVRGRTFRYRAKLTVACSVYESDQVVAFRVRPRLLNEGLSKIDLRAQDEKFVQVQALPRDEWFSDTNVDWDEIPVLILTPLFQEHYWAEPTETIEDDLLVPIQTDANADVLAYLVRARVTTPPKLTASWFRPRGYTWTADVLVPVQLTSSDEGGRPDRNTNVPQLAAAPPQIG